MQGPSYGLTSFAVKITFRTAAFRVLQIATASVSSTTFPRQRKTERTGKMFAQAIRRFPSKWRAIRAASVMSLAVEENLAGMAPGAPWEITILRGESLHRP